MSQRLHKVCFLWLLLLILGLSGCGGGGGDGSGSDTTSAQTIEISPTLISTELGRATRLDLVVDGTQVRATLSLQTPNGTEEYLIIPHSLSFASGSFGFSLIPSVSSLSSLILSKESHPSPDLEELMTNRMAVEAWARHAEREWVRQGFQAARPSSKTLFDTQARSVGEEISFTFETPLTGVIRDIRAIVGAVTPGSLICVDVSSPLPTGVSQPSLSDINDFAESFERIIRPRDQFFFGDASDINGDGKITILLTPLINAFGGISGFFSADDLLSRRINPLSNEQEIFYVAFPTSRIPSELIKATIAHEYQHMINFNQKVLVRGNLLSGTTEETWLNEALAHLAEDLAGYGDAPSSPAELVHFEYFPAIDRISLTAGSDTLARRGAGYLFLRYLFEQLGGATISASGALTDRGGAAFLRRLLSSPDIGVTNIENASQISFEETFRNWVIALALDGTNLSSDPRFNYQPTQVDPITGELSGIDLRGTRRGTNGRTFTLTGPAVQLLAQSLSASVQSTATGYFRFVAPGSSSRSSTVNFSGSASGNLRLTVVRTK
ncbi:MAG: hypothetical protein HY731_04535 [Candidatus Tectomicrobia bacterium]|nr:hypothetical protein [Candidatus Tectomicrobia bacterium]